MSPETYQEADQSIITDALASDDIHRNLYHLCDNIGPRFSGTPGYREAAEYMLAEFDAYGLDQTQLEGFELHAFRRGDAAVLKVIQPFEETLNNYELVYSATTGPDGLEAKLIDIGNGVPERFEAAGETLRGNLALITGPGRHRMAIYEDCVQHGAVGMIYGSHSPGLTLCSGSVCDGKPGAIPAVAIGREDALRLSRRLSETSMTLHLTTTSCTELDTTWNVISDLHGSGSEDEFIIVGGHLDSHEIGPGAYDNAAGAVMVMEIARLLARQRQHLKRSIRFIGFAAEEVGLLGSHAYANAHADELEKARLMFNCDMPALNAPWILASHRCASFESYLPQLNASMNEQMQYRLATHHHSDHYPFTRRGIPGLAMCGSRDTMKQPGFAHAAGDTPEKVPTDEMRNACALAARIVLRASNEDDWPKADADYDDE